VPGYPSAISFGAPVSDIRIELFFDLADSKGSAGEWAGFKTFMNTMSKFYNT
jgi:hypothetical protein